MKLFHFIYNHILYFTDVKEKFLHVMMCLTLIASINGCELKKVRPLSTRNMTARRGIAHAVDKYWLNVINNYIKNIYLVYLQCYSINISNTLLIRRRCRINNNKRFFNVRAVPRNTLKNTFIIIICNRARARCQAKYRLTQIIID